MTVVAYPQTSFLLAASCMLDTTAGLQFAATAAAAAAVVSYPSSCMEIEVVEFLAAAIKGI